MSSRIACFLVLVSLCSAPVYAETVPVQGTAPPQSPPKADVQNVLLKQYIFEQADKLNCYFTIEDDEIEGNSHHLGGVIVPDLKVDTIERLVNTLKQDVPNAVIKRSMSRPSVIHIVAKSLDQDKSYAMNQKIDFSYSGVLGRLPEQLNKHTEGRIGSRPFFYEGEASDDAMTSVTIKAKDASVRDLLTNYVPLASYSRIIWASVTRHSLGKPDTWVQYYGPMQNYSPIHK